MLEFVTDIREFDVLYHNRVCIDLNIRAGRWYKISYKKGFIHKINHYDVIQERPDLKYMSFDIETTKLPLKFPDSAIDQVMMISLMYEGIAVLILNMEICG
jgi:DNA polymerase epsilon subunit 1